MDLEGKVGSGDNCVGQASFTVDVPEPTAGYYRIEIETDLAGGTQNIKSDLIGFEDVRDADFTLWLKTAIEGLDFDTARIVQVAPW
jgi:hypothetical protein